MYNSYTVDISTARKELSRIFDHVFFDKKTYVIMKRNIPLVKITKVEEESTKSIKTKRVDRALFGIWKNKKGKATIIADSLRRKSWSRK